MSELLRAILRRLSREDGFYVSSFGIFTAYTPTWTSSGTAVSLGNGVLTGRYRRTGKMVEVLITLLMGSTTTYGTGDYSFQLPSVPTSQGLTQALVLGSGRALDTGVANRTGIAISATLAGVSPARVRVSTGSTSTTIWGQTVPHTWGNTDELTISCSYEEA